MKELQNRILGSLGRIYDATEASNILRQICLDVLGISQTTFFLKDRVSLNREQEIRLEQILHDLETGRPLQYAIGSTTFCGLELQVDERVLIPRPETSELVEWMLQDTTATSKGAFLDICTGSGCIALAFASARRAWNVHALDISHDALEVAQSNAIANSLNVEFRQQDILKAFISPTPERAAEKQYDIIVSNPPYVLDREKADMTTQVLDFEPHLALFVPDSDPLRFYRAIAEYSLTHLNTGGTLYFEINPLFATETRLMLQERGYRDVLIRRDISGNERMIKAIL